MQLACVLVVSVCSGGQCMFGGLNFKLCFCQNDTGLPGKFLTWCRF